MPKLTKRTVDAAGVREKDYFIWDDDLPGFGLRVFASGKRSYLLQYRAAGRTRRYTIGLHGVWTPEMARQEAKVQLGRVAKGDNPAEERQLDHQAITVKELCQLYLKDLDAGLILGLIGLLMVTDLGAGGAAAACPAFLRRCGARHRRPARSRGMGGRHGDSGGA